MKKTFLIIFGLLQISMILKSQEKIKLYFNNNWEVTSKDKAVYIREAKYDLQNFALNGKVTDRSLDGNLIMEGNYLYGKRNGEFTFYYRTGKIESKGEYLNNQRAGKWVYYYPNGRSKQSVIYFKDKKKGDFSVGEYFDRNGKQMIKNGSGKWQNDSIAISELDNSSLIGITGEFKDSLKSGVWKFVRLSDHMLLQTERFKKGEFKYVKVGIVPYGYNVPFESQTSIGQRLQDEMKSGIAHKNLVGDVKEYVEPGDVNWRTLQQEGKISPVAGGQIVIDEATSTSMKMIAQKTRKVKNVSTVNAFTLIRMKNEGETMKKNPDSKIVKLNRTEMLILDRDVFSQSLFSTDLETFFKTISPTEIKIINRKAMYTRGDDILMAFISANIRYPTEVLQKRIGGTVFVHVTVDSSGNTKEVKVFKGVNEDLDKEAVRVITLIDKWLPAIQDGKAIESTITIPVKFELRN